MTLNELKETYVKSGDTMDYIAWQMAAKMVGEDASPNMEKWG